MLCLTSPTGIANKTNLTVAAGGTFIYDPSVQPPCGERRHVGGFGRQRVAAVPEPGTLALLAAGLVRATSPPRGGEGKGSKTFKTQDPRPHNTFTVLCRRGRPIGRA